MTEPLKTECGLFRTFKTTVALLIKSVTSIVGRSPMHCTPKPEGVWVGVVLGSRVIQHLGPGVGARIRGTLGDIDPLNKVPFKRAKSRVQKGYPLRGTPCA